MFDHWLRAVSPATAGRLERGVQQATWDYRGWRFPSWSRRCHLTAVLSGYETPFRDARPSGRWWAPSVSGTDTGTRASKGACCCLALRSAKRAPLEPASRSQTASGRASAPARAASAMERGPQSCIASTGRCRMHQGLLPAPAASSLTAHSAWGFCLQPHGHGTAPSRFGLQDQESSQQPCWKGALSAKASLVKQESERHSLLNFGDGPSPSSRRFEPVGRKAAQHGGPAGAPPLCGAGWASSSWRGGRWRAWSC